VADEDDVINIDVFEYEGYTVTFPDGKSPHTAYPFALHNTLILPWDYTVKNGVMKSLHEAVVVYLNAEEGMKPVSLANNSSRIRH
jgi:hypothetical protein